MDKENTKTIVQKRKVGDRYVEELEYYDFNLYPLYFIEPGYQLFIVPTDTIEEACYVVRKDDFSINGVSHTKYARELVKSEMFIKREEAEYQNSNGNTPRWKDYQELYEGQEIRYLIEKKGFILFSPPSKSDMTIIPAFIPDIKLLTVQEIHNLFYLLDINPYLHIDEPIKEQLMVKITTKNKGR